MKSVFIKRVVITGLIAGVLDLLAAYTHQYIKTGQFADKMLHYIAGGALGLEKSMQGDVGTQLLGLFFHFFIAFAFTLLFFMIYPRISLQSFNPYLVGFLYGPVIGATMTFVVLPLSKLHPRKEFNLLNALTGWIILGVVVGLPIAISAASYYKNRQPAASKA